MEMVKATLVESAKREAEKPQADSGEEPGSESRPRKTERETER